MRIEMLIILQLIILQHLFHQPPFCLLCCVLQRVQASTSKAKEIKTWAKKVIRANLTR